MYYKNVQDVKEYRHLEWKSNLGPHPTRVFEVVGIDLANPLYLSDDTKAWIDLYTCTVYREIRLEVLTSFLLNALYSY